MQRRERVQQSVSYECNGVKYSRLEDMPPHVREMFIDRDDNGVPDKFEAMMKDAGGESQVFKTERRVIRTFDSQGAMSRIAARGDIDLARAAASHEPMATLVCSQCGYDLKGTPVGGNCPECGRPVTKTIQDVMVPSQTSQYPLLFEIIMQFPGFALALLGFLLVAGWIVLDKVGVL